MKTYIVLIPVEGNVNPRKTCELIENTTFEIGGSIHTMDSKVRDKVIELINDEEEDNGIEVSEMSDFMDTCNNQEIELDEYFISYVMA